MNTEVPYQIFKLNPSGSGKGRKPLMINRTRLLVGRSEACDIVLPHIDVTSIHAVIEIHASGCKIYDMNSTNGTYINNKKIVSSEIKPGDTIKFATQEFEFLEYSKDEETPYPLEMLDPQMPPSIAEVNKSRRAEPVSIPRTIEEAEEPQVPRVQFPLEKDPKALYSEYIFEDTDNLYPIFNYNVSKNAVEVIIIFKDNVFSVDYIPDQDGIYSLVGSLKKKKKDLTYPYLGKEERVPFIEVQNGEVSVFPLRGYEAYKVGSENELNSDTSIDVKPNDIVRFSKDDLEIYVRSTEAPPKVKAAPIIRKDQELRRNAIAMFILIIGFLGFIENFEVDPELDKEKIPERVATILYKKPEIIKKKSVQKTKKEKKKVVQKSPQKKAQPKQPTTDKKTNTPKPKKVAQRKSGTKTAKKTGLVKKAKPNKGPKNTKTNVVKPPKPKVGGVPKPKTSNTKSVAKKAPSKGPVEAYKSFDFKSSISSLMAKGGASKAVKAKSINETDSGNTTLIEGGESATLERANVSTNIGSLKGASVGKLDESQGVEGLVNKKNIYTAGLPYKTIIRGGIDPDIIQQILRDHLQQFRYCYQKELDVASSEFSGVVVMDFIIGASGHVTRASVASKDAGLPPKVNRCVVNVLKGIKFPPVRGGGVVQVNQPFNFYPRQ